MQQWEYALVRIVAAQTVPAQSTMIVYVKDDSTSSQTTKDVMEQDRFVAGQFQQLGRYGWELIAADVAGTFFFKRPKPQG